MGSAEDRTRKTPTPARSPGAAPGELLDVPTLASVAWYVKLQMWLSMHSAPVFGLHAFPRFMSIDKNGGTDSHAPCAVAVSQALRSLRQALACKRVLVHVSARIHEISPSPPDYTRSRSPQAAHVDVSSRVLSPHRVPCTWCTSRCMCV